jgi:rubredoxin
MPSTFECPVCQSRYNNFITSVWDAVSSTEKTTYQCKHCLSLFDIERVYLDEDEDDAELILEM